MKYIYRCNACESRWSTSTPLLTADMLEDLDLTRIICMECSILIATTGGSLDGFIVISKGNKIVHS